MKNNDKDFIDLSDTANWAKLDVQSELDNREINEETGKPYDYAAGFSGDDQEGAGYDALLDGLTSGLNYIPAEFLVAADEKREQEMQEEKPDVSWAYREPKETTGEPLEEVEYTDELPKVNAEADVNTLGLNLEAAKAREEALAKERAEMQAKALAKKEADLMAKEKAEAEAAVQANIEARKKAREEAAAAKQAEIEQLVEENKKHEEEEKAAMEAAEEELFKPEEAGKLNMFSTQMLDIEYIDEVATKEERVAASMINADASEQYEAWVNGDAGDEYVPHKKKKKKKPQVEAEELEEDEDEDEEYLFWYEKIIKFFKTRTALDYIVMATGLLVLIAAIVTGIVFSASKATSEQIARFSPLGAEMQTIGITGSGKLVAVADASRMMAQMVEEEPEEEEPLVKEYDEKEDETLGNISVTMSLTTVKKDLKIKFINAKTKKLVANHEFKVSIEDAEKKKYTATDDDMDGIIYLNTVAPGKAKVSMVALPDDKGVTFSTEVVTINIKEKIDFKKIDVSDEIKSEKDVNAAKEDTAGGLATEGSLTDTVEWVESTKTPLKDPYNEIDKSTIADPSKNVSYKIKQKKLAALPFGLSQLFTWAATEIPPTDDDPVATPTPEPEGPTPDPTPTPEPEVPVDEPTPTPSVEIPSTEPTPTPGVTPTVSDPTAPLKDKKGNQVYIKKDDGTFVEATNADYAKYSVFYLKADEKNVQYKYTGWQEIKGKTYFFDKNGVPVTGEQVIQGAKYNFDSEGALMKGSGTMGIDVSKWNGDINWTAVKNSGVSFVIIRCGYRGSTTGAMIEDPKFKANISGANNAGLKVGIYFFSQAVTDVEGVEEASMTLQLIKGHKISYPIFLDVEDSGGRGDRIDSNTRTQVIQAFCQTIKNGGYTPGVYANKSWLNTKLNAGALSSYKIWLAQYNTAPTYTGKYDLWQYSDKGKVGGISVNTDMNLSYLGY